MGEDQQQNTNNDFQDSSDNATFSAEGDSYNSESNDIQPENKSHKEDKEYCNPHPNIVVNIPHSDDSAAIKEAQRGNSIAKTGLIINGLLFACTFVALVFTWRSIDITNESVTESQKANDISIAALKHSREIDSVNRVSDIQKEYRDSMQRMADYKRDSTNISLSKTSLQSQINSINKEAERFQISNEPFLEIVNREQVTFIEGTEPIFSMAIVNLGQYPCRVVRTNTTIAQRKVMPKFDEVDVKGTEYVDIVNKYITSNTPYLREFAYPKRLTKNDETNLMGGGYSMFFWGYIDYENLVSKKIKTYKFMIKYQYIKELGIVNHEFMVNDNYHK